MLFETNTGAGAVGILGISRDLIARASVSLLAVRIVAAHMRGLSTTDVNELLCPREPCVAERFGALSTI